MGRTTDSIIPSQFLQVLRQVVPQFGEIDRSKGGMLAGYAQQGVLLFTLFPLRSGGTVCSYVYVMCRR